jgi:hypothetical protein
MSDVERWHEWTASIKSVKRLGDGTFAVGSRVLIRQPKLPPAFWKVVAIEPGKSFTWMSVSPGFRAIGYHAVESKQGGSRATLSIEFQGIFGGVFARMTKSITRAISRLRGDRTQGAQRESSISARLGHNRCHALADWETSPRAIP